MLSGATESTGGGVRSPVTEELGEVLGTESGTLAFDRVRCSTRSPLLGGEVGMGARRVIRDVDDSEDAANLVAEQRLDPLP